MNRIATQSLAGGLSILAVMMFVPHLGAQTIAPTYANRFTLKKLIGLNGAPTQMAWGLDGRLYVMTNNNGVWSYTYTADGNLTNPKHAVPDLSGIGIAFDSHYMYLTAGDPNVPNSDAIYRLEDKNHNGIWGETNHGELRTRIVTGIPNGDHDVDQLQVKGNTLYVGIGRRTINGHKGLWSSGSRNDFGGQGFWSGGNGNTWGDAAVNGTLCWIKDLTQVKNTPGAANPWKTAGITQDFVQHDDSIYTTNDPGKLAVHSAGTRNPFGLCFDASGNLWFTNNFNRTYTLGNGDAGFGYLKDTLGPDFSLDVHDQVFKASEGADYGYTDDNWRGVAPPLDKNHAGYHRVRSWTFDNSFNTGPYALTNPAQPDGLGPSSSSDGCSFWYPQHMPAELVGNIFITRFNHSITETSPGNHTLTYADVVAVSTASHKVRRVASGFNSPLCLLWNQSQTLFIGDFGAQAIYALRCNPN